MSIGGEGLVLYTYNGGGMRWKIKILKCITGRIREGSHENGEGSGSGEK